MSISGMMGVSERRHMFLFMLDISNTALLYHGDSMEGAAKCGDRRGGKH